MGSSQPSQKSVDDVKSMVQGAVGEIFDRNPTSYCCPVLSYDTLTSISTFKIYIQCQFPGVVFALCLCFVCHFFDTLVFLWISKKMNIRRTYWHEFISPTFILVCQVLFVCFCNIRQRNLERRRLEQNALLACRFIMNDNQLEQLARIEELPQITRLALTNNPDVPNPDPARPNPIVARPNLNPFLNIPNEV